MLRIADGVGGYEEPSQEEPRESTGSAPAPTSEVAQHPPLADDIILHPDHIDFMFEVEDYEPEENQGFILGRGQRTPLQAVDPGTGEILKGDKARKHTRKRAHKANNNRRDGSGIDIRGDTIEEEPPTLPPDPGGGNISQGPGGASGSTASTASAAMVAAIRASEAPMPTITDRWGNIIQVRGYGTGEYYRLSDQPVWLLQELESTGVSDGLPAQE